MSEEKERIEFAKLPTIENLDAETRTRVTKLLEELDKVVELRSQLSIREDDLKMELEVLQRQTGKLGFRVGLWTFCSQEVKGRRTLDKMLLLENGCPAAVLNASFKQGAPSVRNTFKHLEEDE